MNTVRQLYAKRLSSRFYRSARMLVITLLMASLWLGLIPPPLALGIMPAAMQPLAEKAADLLPDLSVAEAAPAFQAACFELLVTDSSHAWVGKWDSDGNYSSNLVESTVADTFGVDMGRIGPDGNLYFYDSVNRKVRRHNITTGTFIDNFADTTSIVTHGDMAFGPDGNLYVSDRFGDGQILRFDGTTGVFIDVFANRTSVSQMWGPVGLEFSPDGQYLYVGNRNFDNIIRLNAATGAFDSVVFTSGVNLINNPEYVAFGPDGLLYFTDKDGSPGRVKRGDVSTGSWSTFVTPGNNTLGRPAFGPDNNLYVNNTVEHQTYVYDLSGTQLNKFPDPVNTDIQHGARSILFVDCAPTTGTITIVKDAVPDWEAAFTFSAPGLSAGDFQLVDDGVAGGPFPESITFTDVALGTYTISEYAPTSFLWLLSEITIDEGTANSTSSVANREAVVTLDAGESVIVTFTNNAYLHDPTPTYPDSIDGCILMAETNNDDYRTATDTSPILEIDVVADACLAGYSFTPSVISNTYSVTNWQDIFNDSANAYPDNTLICSQGWDRNSSQHSTAAPMSNAQTWDFSMTFDSDATSANLNGMYLETGMQGDDDGAGGVIPYASWSMEVHVWIDGVHDAAFTSPTVLSAYDDTQTGGERAFSSSWRYEYFDFGSTYQNIDFAGKTVVVEVYGWYEPNTAAGFPADLLVDIFLDDMVVFGTEDATTGTCGCSAASEGTITIVKNTVSGDATFDFSSTDTDLAAVSLTTSSNTATSAVITKTAGTYDITEDALTDWTLDNIVISGDTDNGSSTSGATATIDLDAGENIVVTFTNSETPTSPTCEAGTGDLGGNIFRDFNSDGAQSASEPGFSDVTVTAYDNDGNATTTTVNADGTYNFDNIFNGRTGDDAHIRLEFSGLPSWMESGVHGTNSGTTVQRHSAAICAADLAVQNPADYCESNPELATTCFVQQQYTGPYAGDSSFVKYPFTSQGDSLDSDYVAPTMLATHGQTGATYGVAYQRDIETLFISSYLRKGAGFGADGPGAIYAVDNAGNISLHVDINTVFTGDPAGTDPHNFDGDPTTNFYDSGVDTTNIAQVAFGDMDITRDGETLYVVNLADRQIYAIPALITPTAANITQIPTPQPAECGVADTRPFALGIDNNDNLYVGIGCDSASTEQYVYRYDGGTNFTRVLTFSSQEFDTGFGAIQLLTDVVFDRNQDMILGIRDLIGDAFWGDFRNSIGIGEIYRACWNGTGWDLENNGQCGGVSGHDTAGPDFEFYDDGGLLSGPPFRTPMGALALGGQNGLAINFSDPINLQSAGTVFYDATGNQTRRYEVYRSILPEYGKVNGLGDLEALCSTAPLEIGNYVWLDEDGDGIQDPCEEPISGVTLTLHDSTGTQIGTATTDGNGEYYFNDGNVPGGLQPNTQYEIRIDLSQSVVSDYSLTTDNVNSGTSLPDGVDSDATESNGFAVISLTTGNAGENDHTFDFGFVAANSVSIGSYVWEDRDADGVQDAGEPAIQGATVSLLVDDGTGNFVAAVDSAGSAVPNQATGADGLYFFGNLPEGDYKVQVMPSAGMGYVASPVQTTTDNDDAETDSNIAFEPTGGTYESGLFTLSAGGEPTESGTEAGDGQDDGSETNGNMTVDFGFVRPVRIGSYIWEDTDADGTQDVGEPAIEGAMVSLLVDDGGGTFGAATDIDGNPVGNVTTGATGVYSFTNLPEGDYRVWVTPPAGYAPSPAQTTTDNDDAETDSNIASEPAADTFESGTFTLSPGSEPTESGTEAGDAQDDAADTNGNMTVDFGFVSVVSIGSYVWEDTDADGTQDAGEPAILGATVALLVDDGTGSFGAATDIDGAVVVNQTTGADGLYFFDNLPEGSYRVQVTPPSGYQPAPVQTAADNDDSETDSNIASAPTAGTFESGTFALSKGNEPTESGTEAGDSQDDAAIAPEANGNMTVDFGFTPPLSIGNRIWRDADGDGTDNAGSETGVANVTVNLYDAADVTTIISTTTTNAEGFYRFDRLPVGSYVVGIPATMFDEPTDPLYGLVSTQDDVGGADDIEQNDNGGGNDPTTGIQSGTIVLTVDGEPTGEASAPGGANAETLATGNVATDANYNATVDFGFTSLSLGNRVWLDLNGNGLDDDATNAPRGPVTVNLYDAADLTTIISTTTTDADGYYRFDFLVPGNYIVEIPASEFAAGGDLAGWWSTMTGGTSEDVDLDDNGVDPAPAGDTLTNGIQSAAVALGVAAEPTDDTSAGSEPLDQTNVAPDLNYDATVDFGFVQMSLGNRLWQDANGDGLDDGTEPGFDGVVVNLLAADGTTPITDTNGTPIATTTNADSYYRFDGLPPGDYVVQIPASEFGTGEPLAGWWSTADGGTTNSDQDDNGLDPTTPTDVLTNGLLSAVVTLAVGQEPTSEPDLSTGAPPTTGDENYDATVDFGFVQMSLGNRVWEDVDGDGTDNGGTEPGFENVTLNLLHTDGTTPVTDAAGANVTTTTDASGHYRFDNLAPGSYVVQIPATQFAAGAVLADWWSTQTTGTPENSDQDDNGVGPLAQFGERTEGVQSAVVNLTLATENTNDPSNSGQPNGETLDQTGVARDENYDATVDFGFVRLSLGNRVWIDVDGDGTDNAGAEAGTAGVTLVLLDATGIPVTDAAGNPLTATTDPNGYYRFDNLSPSDYIVEIPADQFDDAADPLYQVVSTTSNVGGTDGTDQNDNGEDDPAPATNGIQSASVTLTPNQEPTSEASAGEPAGQPNPASDENFDATVDFGFLPPMSLGNRVWEDVDGDGTDNGGTEQGFANVTVNLYQSSAPTTVFATTTTNADGYYRFDSLAGGDYIVEIPASEFAAGSDLESWWSTTPDTTANAAIGDDQNDNGTDPATPADTVTDGIRSATVSLTRGAEATGETDLSNNLADAADDAQYDATVDFGFARLSLGNRVWFDDDGDGTDNGGAETGAAGVTLNLLDASGNPITDASGAAISTTTDANGYYRFDNLAPGDYHMEIPATDFQSGGVLENWWSTTTSGTEDVDQNDNGSDVTNPRMSGIRSSATATLAIGGEPTGEPSNGDGGLDQTGTASDGNYDATVDFGLVQMSLGNRVFIDANGDGLDDGTEAGAATVTLNLFDASGNPVTDAAGTPISAQTNPEGYYRFDGLEPDTYIVAIPADQFDDAGDTLFNHTSTIDDMNGVVDVDQNDNGIGTDPSSGLQSAPVVLGVGDEPQIEAGGDGTNPPAGAAGDPNGNLTVDFGFVPPMSLGNRVWHDADSDGSDNGGAEAGIATVEVRLLDDTGNPVLNSSGASITTTTDINGYYRFDQLSPGAYIVEIPSTMFDATTDPLYNWFSTGPDTTGDALATDDQNDNGVNDATPAANGIRSGVVTLVLATEPTGEASNSDGGALDQTGVASDENYDATVDFGFIRRDFGDLPDADDGAGYPTTLTDGGEGVGASHLIDGVTFLGSTVDAELDGQPNGAASGDDASLPGDDEDGVSFSELEPGTNLIITVTHTAGVLNAWIDFNGNGVLTDAGEQIATEQTVTAGQTVLNVPVPVDAADVVFSRFRITANPGEATTPAGEAPTGEVEDHVTTTIRRDYGDLPDDDDGLGYPTNLTDGGEGLGASHVIITETNPYLGLGVDPEPDGQPNMRADGDDTPDTITSLNDDEDGVTFDTPIIPGQPFQITVNAGTVGVLNAWIDFDGNGVLTDAGEQIVTEQVVAGPGPQVLNLTAPAIVTETLYSRFRFTQNAGEATTPLGEAPNGEVEDYLLMSLGDTVWLDNGDPTGTADNGQLDAGEQGIETVTVELYRSNQTPGTDTPIATTTTGPNGNYLFTGLISDTYIVHLPASNFADGAVLDDHFSSNDPSNGVGQDPDDLVQDGDDNGVDDPNRETNGISSLPVTLSPGQEPDTVIDGNGLNSNLTVDFGFVAYDFGDLPDGSSDPANSYPVTLADDGARHVIVPGIFLGASVDAEIDGQPNVSADGDDSEVAPDDEDGVTFDSPIMAGEAFTIMVMASNIGGTDGYLNAWMDFNGDGLLDADEQIALDLLLPTGTTQLSFTAPDTVTSGALYSRFRFSGDNPENTMLPTGAWDNGEVEDYVLLSLGDTVWVDDGGADGSGTPNNGVQEGTEAPIAAVTVELYGSNQTPGTDAPIAATITDGDGNYLFTGLDDGEYVVHIPASNFTDDAPLDGYVSSDDEQNGVGQDPDDNETDGDDNGVDPTDEATDGITSLPVTLSRNGEPTSEDGSAFSNLTVDFGVVPLVSVGNIVWFDVNADGEQGAGEPPIEGALVELLNPDGSQAADHEGTAVAPVTTGADGIYNFGNLLAGDYIIRVTPPQGYGPTSTPDDADPDSNESNTDSNGLPTGIESVVESPLFTLAPDAEPSGADQDDQPGGVDPFGLPDNHSNLAIDFGFIQTVSLGNYVWSDDNADGLQTPGEPAMAGALVELLNPDGNPATDANGDPVASVTTTLNGFYNFSNLLPGSYSVQVTLPGGYVPTDTADDADPDTNPANDDSNGLPTGDGAVVQSREVTLYPTTEPTDDEGDQTDPTGTPNDNSNLTIDFGFIPLVSVGNYVWSDDNADGLQGADESPISGATVELLTTEGDVVRDYQGNPVAAQTTDANGLYTFADLLPGDYIVQVTPPGGYVPTQGGVDPDDDASNRDSNGLPVGTGTPGDAAVRSPAVTLAVSSEPTIDGEDGETDPSGTPDANGNLTVDFGFIPLVAVGNRVWQDSNSNGVQDEDEPAIERAIVELLNADGSPATDASGNLVAPALTAPEGLYTFGNLLPGDYMVRVTPPVGYVPTSGGADPDDEPSNSDSNGLPTGADNTVQSPVFSLAPASEPTDEGETDPSGLPDSHSNLTVDFGFIPLVAVGNFVWEDINANGVQDPTESPVAGAVVELRNADGTPATDVDGNPVASQTTGDDGFYNFGNLAPGEYKVRVTPPAGYKPTQTPDNADPDSNESNTDSNGLSTGAGTAADPVMESPVFTLSAGAEPTGTDETDQSEPSNVPDASSNLTVDFGFVPLVAVGSYVWRDTDGDGLQESGEPAIAGAVVELLNPDGSPATDADGTSVEPVTTGEDGLYNFSNLLPGDYIIQATPPDETYQPTDPATASDPDENPANDDSNGLPLAKSNVSRTPVFTLLHGTEPTGEGEDDPSGLPDANSNLTVDFGFVQPVSVGSRIWDDSNANGVQDADEPGLSGATVELLDTDGNPVVDLASNSVEPVTTSGNGIYNFSNLPSGSYRVRVTPPDGYSPSVPASDPNPDTNSNNADSNGVPTGTNRIVASSVFSLVPGSEATGEAETDPSGTPDASSDLTIDFGFFRVLSLGNRVWIDDGAGGGVANNGSIDGAEKGVEGVLVHLLNAERNPVLGPDGQAMSTRTDAEGFYLFDGLKPGHYVIHIDPVNFQSGGPLEGLHSSDVTEINPNRDGDINDNGLNVGTPAIDGVYSGAIELTYNGEPTNEVDNRKGNAMDESSNLTVDFGFYQSSLAVVLNQLLATLNEDGDSIIVRWSTAAEINTFGFHIYAGTSNRFVSSNQLTSRMISGQGSQGGEYTVEIPTSRLAATLGEGIDPLALYIWLVEIENTDHEITYGPVRVYRALKPAVFLPFISR